MREHQFLYALASESELNELAYGLPAATGWSWPSRSSNLRQTPGSVGVLWKKAGIEAPVRPLALVVDPQEQRRLFARFSQIRSDLSPLSAWCHIISPSLFGTLDDVVREADLGGLEASWAGLIIAETAILSDRPVSQLKLAACLATQSFAVARTLAIWPAIPIPDVLGQFDLLQRHIRSGGGHDFGKTYFGPIWATLASLSLGYGPPSGMNERVVNAAMALKRAREMGTDEVLVLERQFEHLPEAEFLSGLAVASPEDRLRAFDSLVKRISVERSQSVHRIELTFLAGYLATVAAGGSASLSLASNAAHVAPEISGWAYLIGGLGEKITWSGGFNGLGRLVVRELMRPFRLDEPPTADFAVDEANVLVDRQLADPLVHLQLKQSRIATAALFPGVNLQVPFAEQVPEPRRQPDVKRSTQPPTSLKTSAAEEALKAIVNALAPMILEKVRDELPQNSRERGSKGKWPKGSQRKLPLDEDE